MSTDCPIALRTVPEGTLVKVRAAPAAARERVVPHGDALKVAVRAPPERGQANDAIARLLASRLGLRPSRVSLQSGATARDKWFLVAGIDAPGVKELLTHLEP
jgi:hypothetical protein